MRPEGRPRTPGLQEPLKRVVTTTLTRSERQRRRRGAAAAAIVRAVAERCGDPDWVRDLRAQGWEAWQDIPLPDATAPKAGGAPTCAGSISTALHPRGPRPPRSRRWSAWRTCPPRCSTSSRPAWTRAGLLVEQDGSPALPRLQDEPRRQGVIFTDLHTAFREHRDLVRALLHAPRAAALGAGRAVQRRQVRGPQRRLLRRRAVRLRPPGYAPSPCPCAPSSGPPVRTAPSSPAP